MSVLKSGIYDKFFKGEVLYRIFHKIKQMKSAELVEIHNQLWPEEPIEYRPGGHK